MLGNEKGITFIESLAAATVIFTVIMTMIPLYNWISMERHDLQNKRIYAHQLYNQLITIINEQERESKLPYERKVEAARFSFSMSDNLTKGCVQWENSKNKQEEICLYAK